MWISHGEMGYFVYQELSYSLKKKDLSMKKFILVLFALIGLKNPIALAHVDGSDLIKCEEHRAPSSPTPNYLFSEFKNIGFYAVLPQRNLAFRRQIVEISAKIPVRWKNHTDLKNTQINFRFSLFDSRGQSAKQSTTIGGLGTILGFNLAMTNPDGKTSSVDTGSSPFQGGYALVRVTRELTILSESEKATGTQALFCVLVPAREFKFLVESKFFAKEFPQVKSMEEFLIAKGLVKLEAQHISGELLP
jgi:hypothetical protein